MQSEAQNLAIVFSGLRDEGKKETCVGKRVSGVKGRESEAVGGWKGVYQGLGTISEGAGSIVSLCVLRSGAFSGKSSSLRWLHYQQASLVPRNPPSL